MWALLVTATLAGAAAFDAETIPKAEAGIADACGAKPAVAVRWSEFDDDEAAAGALMGDGLAFLTAAFTTVCKDAALKEEVAKQIKKVALTQAHGAADPVVYISAGILNIEYLWVKGEPPPDAAFIAAEIASRLNGEEAEAP